MGQSVYVDLLGTWHGVSLMGTHARSHDGWLIRKDDVFGVEVEDVCTFDFDRAVDELIAGKEVEAIDNHDCVKDAKLIYVFGEQYVLIDNMLWKRRHGVKLRFRLKKPRDMTIDNAGTVWRDCCDFAVSYIDDFNERRETGYLLTNAERAVHDELVKTWKQSKKRQFAIDSSGRVRDKATLLQVSYAALSDLEKFYYNELVRGWERDKLNDFALKFPAPDGCSWESKNGEFFIKTPTGNRHIPTNKSAVKKYKVAAALMNAKEHLDGLRGKK